MAQAREAEPDEWKLLKDFGYKFSKGEPIIIDNENIDGNDKIHKLSRFERRASNKNAIRIAIWIFIICHAAILLASCIVYFVC